MSQKMGSSKKKRTPKTSKGVHGGGGKVKLDRLQLFLMGKGPTARVATQMYRDSQRVKVAR